MKWASALSEQTHLGKAAGECIRKIQEVERTPPDLVVTFPSGHHAPGYGALPELLSKGLGPRHLLGCSGGGVIGAGKEVERRPALSVVAAWLPGVEMRLFQVQQESMPDPDAPPGAWREWIGVQDASLRPDFLVLSDPFSINPEEMARGLDYAFPRSTKVGGLASGASEPGGNALYLDGRVFDRGAVGAAFWGDIAIDPIVAQGCRPIGQPYAVTKCDRNLLLELDDKPTLEVLERLLGGLSPADQELARTSLFIGVLSDALKSGEEGRDYLIRNLIGLDPRRGILAVGAYLRPGQTVRFHLRDRHTSAQDLDERLSRYLKQGLGARPAGALLFSCMGRGEHLYRTPNHDSDLFLKKLGPLALGGFFCNGEIGPVDGTTYLHGYTSCFGIFRPAGPAA